MSTSSPHHPPAVTGPDASGGPDAASTAGPEADAGADDAPALWLSRPGLLPVLLVIGPVYLVGAVTTTFTLYDDVAHRAVAVAGAAIMVPTWLRFRGRGLRDVHRDLPWPTLVAMLAVAVVLTVADGPVWSGLFIAVAAATGIRYGGPRALAVVAACTVLVGASTAAHSAVTVTGPRPDRGDALSLMIETMIFGLLTQSFGQTLRTNHELRLARAQVARLAVADERLRFARDLHDLLGHSLSLIALKAELAGRLVPREPDRARAELADIEAVSRSTLEDVRQAVRGYRRPDLAEELAGAAEVLRAAGVTATIDPVPSPLPPGVDEVLAWSVREGVTNVVRHAGAAHCEVRVARTGDHAVVEVADDGRGARVAGAPVGGHGLAGLGERVAARGGTVHTATARGGGFRLRVEVPVDEA